MDMTHTILLATYYLGMLGTNPVVMVGLAEVCLSSVLQACWARKAVAAFVSTSSLSL